MHMNMIDERKQEHIQALNSLSPIVAEKINNNFNQHLERHF